MYTLLLVLGSQVAAFGEGVSLEAKLLSRSVVLTT